MCFSIFPRDESIGVVVVLVCLNVMLRIIRRVPSRDIRDHPRLTRTDFRKSASIGSRHLCKQTITVRSTFFNSFLNFATSEKSEFFESSDYDGDIKCRRIYAALYQSSI